MIPTLYRALLKQARQLDRSGPSLTSLIHRSEAEGVFLPQSDDLTPRELAVAQRYNTLLTSYLGSPEAALLSPSRASSLSVSQVVKDGFREHGDTEERIDTAFLSLRELGNKIRWGEILGLPSLASSPTSSIRSWGGEPSAMVEGTDPGTFLIAHPLLGDYFSRSVIFLTHGTCDSDTVGYIINSPPQLTKFKVTNEWAARTGGYDESTVAGVVGNMVRIGGPQPVSAYDPLRNLGMLHRERWEGDEVMRDLGGDGINNLKEVGVGGGRVYQNGDLDRCILGLSKGEIRPEDVALMTNVAVWRPGQLEMELERGFWIPCKADLNMVFENDGEGDFGVEGCDMWSTLMREMGYEEVREEGRDGGGKRARGRSRTLSPTSPSR